MIEIDRNSLNELMKNPVKYQVRTSPPLKRASHPSGEQITATKITKADVMTMTCLWKYKEQNFTEISLKNINLRYVTV